MSISNQLKIPARILEKVSENIEIHGAVLTSFNNFIPFLNNSRIPFFSEYTNHGIDHIYEVATSAEALITNQAWEMLTPSDAGVLLLSVLVHDLGMHLTEDGFISLLQRKEVIKPYDNFTWAELWSDYGGEIKRYDATRLNRMFGSPDPVDLPSDNTNLWTDKSKAIIGEFLRRHHHRLANEIALWGMPTPISSSSQPLKLASLPSNLISLIGRIARSHGDSLRYSIDQIPRDERRESAGVHTPYLMALLRIADYLQLQRERAPHQILQVKTIKSPISKLEWGAHEAIEYVNQSHDDPESVYVKVNPKNIELYAKISRLLTGLQYEIDASWAALGEVYGGNES